MTLPTASGWHLVWRDEFSGAAIDTTRWGFDLGNSIMSDDGQTTVSGWGNNELECYTASPENAFLRDGMPHLRARTSTAPGCPYTSARMTTRRRDGSAHFARRYGRFEFRAKLPIGRGAVAGAVAAAARRPLRTVAASGEIDLMEARGQSP